MNYDSRIDANSPDAQAVRGNPFEEILPEERRSRRRLWIIAVVVLLLMAATWWLLNRNAAPADDSATKDQAPVVTVITPGKTTIEGTINANGTLAARRELPVGSVGEGGQVVSVLVEPGQWVGAGQVLAVVDRSVQVQQQASQAAQIQVAQADARLAQANLDRASALVTRGFISKAEVDRLTATRDAANARIRVASATLGQLRAQAARLNIVAPAAGLILERKIEPGQVVSAGSGVLFRIAKGGEMELKAQLGQVELSRLSPGVTAQVTPVGSEHVYTGQVWQIAPVIDPASRQGFARIALAYAPDLPPGGFASAVIRSGTVVAPMLPESALLSDSQGSYVFIIGKDNKVARRAVKLGLVTDKGIVITEGLDGSERVVMRAGSFLAVGQAVKPAAAK